jgi:hypothetical protein
LEWPKGFLYYFLNILVGQWSKCIFLNTASWTGLMVVSYCFSLKKPSISFFKNWKVVLLVLQILRHFFSGRSRLDTNILIEIISKGVRNYEWKFFQIGSFFTLLEFLSPLRKLIKLWEIIQNSTLWFTLSQSNCFGIFLLKIWMFLHIFVLIFI